MDLEALRKAALSSKKRKLEQQQQQQERIEPKEEGEIDDDNPQPTTTTTTTTTRLNLSHSSASPAAFFAIKEECKGIISQLLSYGIPPDYMLSIGVSREILKLAFFELHLDLNLIPPSPNLSAQSIPFEPSSSSSSSNFSTPLNAKSVQPGGERVLSLSLEALEQEKRKKLFAKKAALKLRNQRQAQNLESELETLFSSTPQDVNMNARTDEGELEEEEDITKTLNSRKPSPSEEPLAKRPRHSLLSDAEHLHSLRESIDHTEEVVELPPTGPFAYNPSFNHHHHSQLAPPPTNRNNVNNRPRATDLEHLPPQRLSETALSRQKIVGGFGGSLFNGINGGGDQVAGDSLIIEISDDDEEEEEEGREGDSATTTTKETDQSIIPSRTHSPNNNNPNPSTTTLPAQSSSTNALASSSKAAQVGEILRQRQLLEKELEIKKIMEKIKDMESRKKRGGSSTPTPTVTASESVPVVVAEEQKKEEISEESKIESNIKEPQSQLNSAPLPPPQAPPTISLTQPIDPVYRPYNSTLSRYPLLGGKPQPNFDQTSKNSQLSAHSDLPDLDSSTTTNNDQEEEGKEFKSIDLGSAGLTTFIAKKKKLDPIKKFCKVESFGGVCQDSNCKNLHERDFKPKGMCFFFLSCYFSLLLQFSVNDRDPEGGGSGKDEREEVNELERRRGRGISPLTNFSFFGFVFLELCIEEEKAEYLLQQQQRQQL